MTPYLFGFQHFFQNALIFLPEIIYAIYTVENKWNGDIDHLNSLRYENKTRPLIIVLT